MIGQNRHLLERRPADDWLLPDGERRRDLPGEPDVFFWRAAVAVEVGMWPSCPSRPVNESARGAIRVIFPASR